MVLKDILAIAGENGLFKFLAQGKNAIIVEHLETGKRSSAYGTAKVSSLDDIAIFTDEQEVPLGDIFNKIFEKEDGAETINHKATSDELKKYFAEVLPDYDRDRVYVSDIRKLIQWYNILHSLDMLIMEEAEETVEAEKADGSEETVTEAEAVKTEGEVPADAKVKAAKGTKADAKVKAVEGEPKETKKKE